MQNALDLVIISKEINFRIRFHLRFPSKLIKGLFKFVDFKLNLYDKISPRSI